MLKEKGTWQIWDRAEREVDFNPWLKEIIIRGSAL